MKWSITEGIAHLVTALLRPVGQYIYHDRLARCRECSWGDSNRCAGSGAFNPLRARARTSACPLRKWPIPASYPDITTTNLIYHVFPSPRNDVWRKNLHQLLQRWSVFSGERVVAVATGPGLGHPNMVREMIRCDRARFIEVPNDRRLREVASFRTLLEAVESSDPATATFYAHTKGTATAGNPRGAQLWRNAMYRHLLDDMTAVRQALRHYPCVGTHKMVWPPGARPPYPTGLRHGQWMFAGTFFWFRNDAVFGHPRWADVPHDRYGAEAWLSGLFEPNQGRSMFQLWPEWQYPTPSPYDPALYTIPMGDFQ